MDAMKFGHGMNFSFEHFSRNWFVLPSSLGSIFFILPSTHLRVGRPECHEIWSRHELPVCGFLTQLVRFAFVSLGSIFFILPSTHLRVGRPECHEILSRHEFPV
jgi:hypothetical protein